MSSDRKVTRSVYENAKGIVEQKGKWANAAANKTDPSIYEEAAKPSYKYLEENGAADIAEKLHGYDYSQALEYVNTLEPESETANTFNGMISAVKEKSDSVFETAKKDKEELAADYNEYISYAKEGYSGKDYANAIQNSYKEMGEKATRGVLASKGAENSGNIDSYAKAQAQRSELAYANAGNAAALDQYNAIMQNYLSGIEGKSAAITGMIDRLQQNVVMDQSYYAEMYNAMRAADLAEKQAYYDDLNNSRKAENERLIAEQEHESALRNAEVDLVKELSSIATSQMEATGKVDGEVMDLISALTGKGTSSGETVNGIPLRDKESSSEKDNSVSNGESTGNTAPNLSAPPAEVQKLTYSRALQEVRSKAIGERESFINKLVDEGAITPDEAVALYAETVDILNTGNRAAGGISLQNADSRNALAAGTTGIPIVFG